VTNSTTGIVTNSTTGFVTNSTTEIVTNSTTEIVTNSTTEIGTVKFLSGTKCKIISTRQKGVYGGVGVWLLSLTCARVKGQWFTSKPRPLHSVSKTNRYLR
jgi:hypothetical protein